MNPRRSRAARMVLIWLMLLAASPVTAPFSSCDFGDFTPGVPCQGTTVKAKGFDQHLLCLATFVEDTSYVLSFQGVARACGFADDVCADRLTIPLRI